MTAGIRKKQKHNENNGSGDGGMISWLWVIPVWVLGGLHGFYRGYRFRRQQEAIERLKQATERLKRLSETGTTQEKDTEDAIGRLRQATDTLSKKGETEETAL